MPEANINLRSDLENHIRFETLIADLSAGFINLPPDQVDSGIEDAQRLVCECLNLDRSSFWLVSEREPGVMLMRHLQQFHDGFPTPEQPDASELFPWTMQKILAGETVLITRLSDLPPEAGRDQASFSQYGTKSVVVVPFSVGGERPFGCLTFAMMRQERDWPKTVVKGFHLIAQVFANALARKQADEALRESQLRLQLAADSADAGLWILDISTRGLWLTDKTRELFNFSSDGEVTFESILNVVHSDDREQVRQAVDQTQHSNELIHVEYRIICPDGNIRWMKSRGRIHSADSEKSNRLMGVSIDITERKRSEKQLEKQLNFERLLSGISAKFVNLPPSQLDCEIQDAMRRVCQLLGIELAVLWQWSITAPRVITPTHFYRAMKGTQSSEGLKQEDYPWCVRQMRTGCIVAVSSLEDLPAEAARDLESARRIGIKSSLTLPLTMGGGPPIGALAFNTLQEERDWPDELVQRLQLVTQVFTNALGRKRAEDEIIRLRDEYAHIARVSAMGELTASLAHELKQPLAAIRSNAQAALRFLTGDNPDIDELHEVLKDIIADNRRADDVIGKLRTLMRKSKPQITELDMNELVRDILPLVSNHEAMRKISLHLELDETLPPVAGDRIQIQQVILNLILNSTEALVKTRKQFRSITLQAYQQDSETVTVSVKDNGPGVEPEAIPHLFEAFYTTKQEGLGMGLAICRSIVEEHGGRLWAENNHTGGVTFYFTIPIAKEKIA